jgi:hypothetical protein
MVFPFSFTVLDPALLSTKPKADRGPVFNFLVAVQHNRLKNQEGHYNPS